MSPILRVWSGAIFMNSPLESMESLPYFSMMDEGLSCHFVEYGESGKFWKFLWSKGREYGYGEIFVTARLKEDPSNNQDRYFNDVKGVEQNNFNSTFTLTSKPAFDRNLSFVYRQRFSEATYAFFGALDEVNTDQVPEILMQKFIDEA